MFFIFFTPFMGSDQQSDRGGEGRGGGPAFVQTGLVGRPGEQAAHQQDWGLPQQHPECPETSLTALPFSVGSTCYVSRTTGGYGSTGDPALAASWRALCEPGPPPLTRPRVHVRLCHSQVSSPRPAKHLYATLLTFCGWL